MVRYWWILGLTLVGLSGCAARSQPASTPRTRLGIDVLQQDAFDRLVGERVAILTNRTGRDSEGRRTIDTLVGAPDVQVVRLLSPEHGLATKVEGQVADSVEAATGLPVYSLYGETRRPTSAMLSGLDTVVFDVQDIGVRFYTYITTLGYLLEACAENDVRVVVLDRPNPIGPLGVDGPNADADLLDFIAYRSIPIVHGMTVGEIARYFNAEFGIDCELEIVRMEHWRRDAWWSDTGCLWIDPSPNIRNPNQTVLYPGIGMLEASTISVGRGTDQPFETLGAPWIDARQLAHALQRSQLPGVSFVPIEFTPTTSKHAERKCGGVHIEVVDRDKVEPITLGLVIAWHLERLYPADFDDTKLLRLMKNRAILDAWRNCERLSDVVDLANAWTASARAFRQKSRRYWLYR